LLTRRVSIGDGAHRKKSHADGTSVFQGMSSAVERSHSNPPNAAGRNEERGKNRPPRATRRLAGQGAAMNPPANFRHDLVWRSRARKCETARPPIYLPGRRRETELPRDWRGCKIHGPVVARLRARVETCGRAGSSENSAARAQRVQSEAAGLRRPSPPPNLRNRAQCRRSMRRLCRIVVSTRARS
jgi:hypothetical protein